MFFQNKTDKGFTLIEIIASLVLAGILAAVAGMGIVQATKAFLFTRQTTEISQKNSLPMIRMRRSVMNLTDVSAIGSRSLTLNRLSSGTEISETYNWGGNIGNPLTVSINGGAAQTLADNIQNFSLSFVNSKNTAWTVTDPLTDLAHITIDLTLQGGSATNIVFSENVVPRNTYLPSSSAGVSAGTTSGQQTPFCLIQNNAFSSDANPGIRVIREFKNRILSNLPFGKEIIRLYYRLSLGAGTLSGSHPAIGSGFRTLLLPFTGLFFLILYYPLGILWFFLLSLLLVRLMLKLNVFKRPGLVMLNNTRGSILITIIATMVIMGFLSIAMVSMFSSSVMGTVPPQMSQRAYYVAESGKRYAVKAFLANQNNDQAFINALHINQAFPLGDDSFTLELEGYWYNKPAAANNFSSVTVSPFGDFPSEIKTQSCSGYIQLPDIAALVQYTATSYNSGSNTVVFTLAAPVTSNSGAGAVHIGARADSQTLTATELGKDPNLTHVLVTENSLQTAAFPGVNGLISLKDSANHDWVLIYRKKLPNGNLAGLQYIPGQSYTATGITLANDTELVLGRHAIFTSTGRSGTGAFQSTQAIRVHQPLDSIELYKNIEGGIDFNAPSDISKVNSKLGTHAIDNGALKVTGTSTTYSYTSFNGAPVYQQESLSTVNWANTSFPSDFLKNIWNRSSQKLTYDLQAKIKFTETEDDIDSSPVNHPGSYMPGISFRVLAPNTGNFGQATYYGLSVMRGIQGLEDNTTGCGGGSYSENDDITDNLFKDHGSNSSAATVGTCPGSSFVPSSWNDDPPLDGIPYLVLWQKDISTNAAGNAVTTGCFGGSDYSPWEWLSYMSLVEVQPVTVYEYRQNGTTNYSYYEGQIPSGRLPTTYMSYTNQSFVAWKLKDRFGVLKTTDITEDGVTTTTLGSPGSSGILVRNPLTVNSTDPAATYPHGLPVTTFNGSAAVVGYILNPTAAYSTEVRKSQINYKIYLKPWTTLMVRVFEMEGDLDCNPATGTAGKERVNAVSAYIAGPEATSGTLGYPKDSIRLAHPRNTVKWTANGDYFTTVIWKGLNSSGVIQNETGYTSKLVPNPQSNGCGGTGVNIKLVEKGKDNVDDNLITYTAAYTTQNYGPYFNNPAATYNVAEFGLHSLGINSDTAAAASNRETVYFDDFYWSLWEGGAAGIFPGIQEQ